MELFVVVECFAHVGVHIEGVAWFGVVFGPPFSVFSQFFDVEMSTFAKNEFES